jgi:hypothetical protein
LQKNKPLCLHFDRFWHWKPCYYYIYWTLFSAHCLHYFLPIAYVMFILTQRLVPVLGHVRVKIEESLNLCRSLLTSMGGRGHCNCPGLNNLHTKIKWNTDTNIINGKLCCCCFPQCKNICVCFVQNGIYFWWINSRKK